jgi:SAM-dependent methyltransferase
MQDDISTTAAFIEGAIRELGGLGHSRLPTVLDFGCGRGQLVQALLQLGFDAYGCDTRAHWSREQSAITSRLRTIALSPYRLPFGDDTFEAIVSTSVLEHAQNKEDCFREMRRVLKPGGSAMHLYPGKWYLPYEPHIYVPLANYFWPRCPKWWLGLWALLGVRNEFQRDQPWRAVAAANHRYCRNELSYWTTRQYRDLSSRVFGNCQWPMQFYLDNAPGRFARLFKQLPFTALSGVLSREIRMGFLVHKKRA